ncbi:ferrous iron transporter A [Clostridium botulinum]|uniref:Rqc2 homolog RqcH n=4 Tax=Clostridium botulinum TaxID=1491 RepID=A0A0A0IMP2_CLOBO|nr:NFACT RNA binding domain-containing protein [Clostridium botulinum]KGN01904.1 ferrous iron transporter A [Clostridium botulinum C/D str. DC5]KOC55648.1 ferrous iron transporter A [Clostridium botulinum]KOC57555.1 ferrous iron transporter A [Clostridium botulinum]MCD3232765.1 fibronectin/fibrinogen-binding protein [Clostridium botulinum D/C]MCD3238627.1 fibronectin/fibrinogen-binding protein [Clostridium botulinum D/C]
MALDGIFLYSIIDELKTNLVNGKIDKVNQPEKDEIILNVRKGKSSYKLLISSSSNYPRIHLSNLTKPNPIKAPMFCMVLRKYINNAKILDVYQIDNDRIAVIDFESTDELGFNSIYSLIIEIMGRHSNITLVRKRDNIVMDSIKHITPDINTYRCIYPGIEYVYPPKSLKLNPFTFTYEEINDYIINNHIEFNNNIFSKIFTGVSKTLSSEICYRLQKQNIELNISSLNYITSFLKKVLKNIELKKFIFNSYKKNNALLDFYCLELTCYNDYSMINYESPSTLSENFYYAKDKADRLKAKSSDLQKIVLNNINRCIKKDKILNKTLEKCSNKETSKLYGELLTANIYALKKGMNEIELSNYYSENYDMVKIPLDENKTPSQNIQLYYKKYNKLKKSEEAAHTQLEQNKEELDYLYSVLTNINNADNYDEIEEIKKELIETGYIKFKKIYKTKKSKISKPIHFISKDGFHIYVGKNNIQNDYLTLKFANKHDIWFHTKNIPGSHVIIKNTGNIPESTLLEAANLAAYYSKSQTSSNVPVDYTEIKNVKKPNGAKPGMVIYSTNQTIYITPTNPELN